MAKFEPPLNNDTTPAGNVILIIFAVFICAVMVTNLLRIYYA